MAEYNQDVAAEEQYYQDWLIANEDLKGSEIYKEAEDYYNDLSGYYATPAGFLKTALPAAMGELGTVKDEIGKFISNPVQGTKNAIGGVADIATTAATNLLPKEVVDMLYSGMDDPTSNAYKLNQMLPEFLQTKERAQYETMGEQIGTQVSNTADLLSSPDTAAKLIAQNPLESLTYASGVGGVVKAPIKAAGLLDSKIGKVIDVATDQSPTSLLSGVPQILKSRANKAGDIKAGKQITADAIIKEGVAAGYDLPPSAYKGTGILNKIGKNIETFPMTGNTPGKIIIKNQETTDRLMRKFLNITDDVPFEDVLSTVRTRSGPVYEKVQALKAVKKTTTGKKWVDAGPLMGKKLIDTKKTKTIYRDGKKIFNDLEASRTKQDKLFKQGDYDGGVKQGEATAKFNQELLELATYHKKPKLVKELNAARTDYAKAYSVFPYVADGSVNASAFAKANRYNTQLTGEGKVIRDFANVPNNKRYLNLPLAKDAETFTNLEKYALGAATVADASSAGLIGLAGNIIPSILTSRKLGRQNKFMNPNYGANGLLSTLGNPKTVRNAVTFPTLLSQSGIEDIEYLNRGLEPEMEEILIRGGGAR